MALNQKYTWADFLQEHPEKKDVKRTSTEGKKAFEQAYKARVKDYLKERLERLNKQHAGATKARDELVGRLKATKAAVVAKRLQLRVGQKDHAMAAIVQQIERTKAVQKQI